MFAITNVDLGTISVGKEVTIEFPYTDIDLVTRIESPCDCSRVHNVATEKKIVIKYTPTSIPIHLKQQGQNSYKSHKEIKVEYTNKFESELKQTLSFTAIVEN